MTDEITTPVVDTAVNKTTILSILQLAMEYGPDLVVKMVNLFAKTTITEQDVEDLKVMIKKPEDYFK